MSKSLIYHFNTRMTKKDKEKQKIDLIMLIHKGYEGGHFDRFGNSSVKEARVNDPRIFLFTLRNNEFKTKFSDVFIHSSYSIYFFVFLN